MNRFTVLRATDLLDGDYYVVHDQLTDKFSARYQTKFEAETTREWLALRWLGYPELKRLLTLSNQRA